MSKGNMFLGYARGKVGSVVFSRADGKQITRAKADKVSNPKTRSQVLQRTIINTVSQAYSVLSAICDHSFQGKKRGQQNMSEFMKKNADLLRSIVATQGTTAKSFCAIGKSGYYHNPYVVASGTLPAVAYTVAASGMTVTLGLGSGGTLTYESVIGALNLQRGDQLTFLLIDGNSGVDASGFKYCRIILDPRETDGSPAALSSTFLTKPNPRNENVAAFDISLDSGNMLVDLEDTSATVLSGAVIVSRKDGNGWKRSAAKMALASSAQTGTNDKTMDDAIAYAMFSNIDLGSDIYLNNASNG